ncbi:hypothetical protein ACOR62_09295 [Neisseria lisongii]|uniref:Lipoprotein n=1 Tax=Neisseria lisongii TaxID=2912188 RepID=A0AAW5AGA4_9NEIS|nr:hypothetical protein [Neisseria lisongii]MCF7530115.1 hypothetical protein [Neisseria lisongii]
MKPNHLAALLPLLAACAVAAENRPSENPNADISPSSATERPQPEQPTDKRCVLAGVARKQNTAQANGGKQRICVLQRLSWREIF